MTSYRILVFLVTMLLLVACDPFGADPGDSGHSCYSDGCDISGRVMTENGKPLRDVRVAISGGGGWHVVTDRNGNFSFPRLVMLRDYCITPAKGPWEFEPEQYCYKDLAQNYANQDFVAAHVESFDVTGYVFDRQAMPMREVLLFLTGGAEMHVRTNISGFYAFRGLRGREDYCISPYMEGYTFEPAERCYTYLDSLFEDQNYLATEDE